MPAPPTTTAGTPTTSALRRLLEGPDFRRLLRVRMAGQFGDGLFQGALFAAVFFDPTKATSAAQAAAAFTTLLLPYSLVGPFAGVFLDRWRRQRVLLQPHNESRATSTSTMMGSQCMTPSPSYAQ